MLFVKHFWPPHSKHVVGIYFLVTSNRASQVVAMLKNLPANAGDTRDSGLLPGSGRSPRGGNGNPLQYSCLENSMDRGV